MFPGEDRPHGALASFADLTDERRAWVEVRRREAQLRLAMECAGHEFWELDVVRSELSRGLGGARPEALVGGGAAQASAVPLGEPSRPSDAHAWLALIHPEDRERTLADLKEHVAGRKPTYVSELRLPAPAGGHGAGC